LIKFKLRTLIAIEIVTVLVLSVALGSMVFIMDISTRVREHYSRDLGILRQAFLSHRNEIVNGSVDGFEQSLLGIANVYGINSFDIQYMMTGDRHHVSRELPDSSATPKVKPNCSRGEISSILQSGDICFQNSFTWDDQGDDPLVRVRWFVPPESSDHASSALLILSSIVLLGLTLCAFHWILFKRVILAPIANATARFDSWVRLGVSTPATFDNVFSASEINKLLSQIDKLLAMAKDYQEVREKSIRLEASETIAHQVAHDIQSPLAAISVVEKELLELPEDKRTMLRSAANRIRDIANDLLSRSGESGRSKNPLVKSANDREEPALVSAILEGMISEKRLQFRSKIGVEILLHLDASSYGLFARIVPKEFKRVISNLVNNAVEAIESGGGQVNVCLKGKGQKVEIEIQDTGKGIPEELLPKLGVKGETHGKPGGSGLGLHHAMTCVATWGGDLEIQSKQNEGTKISITLPKTKAPNWFLEKLIFPMQSQIVVLDDDVAIHQIWKKRLQTKACKEKGITLQNFSTPDELRKLVLTQDISRTHFLVDYELIGFPESGLDICEELNILKQSTLVTGRYEEEEVRTRCEALDMKIVPKGLAGIAPVEISTVRPKRTPKAVLIDDDTLVRLTWLESARETQSELLAFKTPQEFFDAAPDLEPNTPIYIDSDLGLGVKGELIAKDIFALGFENIYLASGFPKEHFTRHDLTWVRDVVGKDPVV
jgi:signal transduction histidine kinase